MFGWGTENEIVPVIVLPGLLAVADLKACFKVSELKEMATDWLLVLSEQNRRSRCHGHELIPFLVKEKTSVNGMLLNAAEENLSKDQRLAMLLLEVDKNRAASESAENLVRHQPI
mgnify:CR=1 FL=1